MEKIFDDWRLEVTGNHASIIDRFGNVTFRYFLTDSEVGEVDLATTEDEVLAILEKEQ